MSGRGRTGGVPAAVQALVSGAWKMRAELSRRFAAAAFSNPYTRTPLAAVPAWAGSTVYVTGMYASNGGNEYVCRVGGTSAASVGPSGQGLGDIVDGTVTWQYVQPQRATSTSADAPTITFSASAANLTKFYDPVDNASAFGLYGGTPTASGTGVVFTSVSTLQAGTVITTAPGKDSVNPCIHFITDAQVIAVQSASFLTNLRRFYVEVDGVMFRDAPVPGDSTGPYMLISFAGKARKARSIKIHWRRGAPEVFEGVYVATSESVWAPPRSPRVVVLGDSLTEGSNYGGGYNSGDDWVTMFGRLLGVDDAWNIGKGSTGFVTTASGTRYTHLQRLADATAPNPDVLVIAGCHNDDISDRATIGAAVLAYLQAFRAACPNTLIVVCGTIRTLVHNTTIAAMLEGAMADAVTAFADANTVFVPVHSEPAGPWINGSRTAAAVTGISNAASAVVTVANSATVGQTAMLHNINGMAINGIPARITAASGTQITLALDSTSLGTFTTSASSFVAFDDVYSSADSIHPTPQGVMYLARRYAHALRDALRQLLPV